MEEEAPEIDGNALREEGNKWLGRIRRRLEDEKDWRDNAQAAERAYSIDAKGEMGRLYDFNILHSNVETIVPAVYNSSPIPDIRRRYGDKDPVARDFADVIERGISMQIDDNKLDAEMERLALDAFLAGRGIIRLQFESEDGPDGNPTNERVNCIAWAWRDFVMARAQRWDDVNWVAFRHCLDRDEVERMADKETYDAQFMKGSDAGKPLLAQDKDDLFVWEVWCKTSKTVKFIRDEDGAILSKTDDPLGLPGFFPMPEPVQPIALTGNMMPICPFKAYEKLAIELDNITRRINKIMSGLKVRGGIVGDAGNIQRIAQADDNELVTLDNLEQVAATKGLDGAITWWPVDKAIMVLKELYQQREMVKQTIYEITGISDIVRGASNSNETATAQQIKTQWGSLRIQKMQRLIQRQVRDVFVIMADILVNKFSFQTLQQMTGIQILPSPADAPQPMDPPEVQQQKQAKLQKTMQLFEMFQNPKLNEYRIDIESDSTIRADMTRVKGEMTEFLNGTAQYFGTMAPVVQSSPSTAVAVAEIYGAFARNFRLGRQAEAALESMIEKAEQSAKQPKDKPNPEMEKLKADMELKKADQQLKQADKQAEFGLKQSDHQMQRERMEAEMAMAREKHQMEMQKMQMELRGKQAEQGVYVDEDGEQLTTPADNLAASVAAMSEQIASATEMMAQAVQSIAQSSSAPKEVVYDDQGRVVGVKPSDRVIN